MPRCALIDRCRGIRQFSNNPLQCGQSKTIDISEAGFYSSLRPDVSVLVT